MPVGINFQKSQSEYLVDCLANGKSIEGVRTVDDMLALAGACFFVVMSHGPALKKGVDWSKVPKEYKEAEDVRLFADIHLAIEYFGQLSMKVQDGEYDETYEPQVKAIVYTDGEKKTLVPLKGFRKAR